LPRPVARLLTSLAPGCLLCPFVLSPAGCCACAFFFLIGVVLVLGPRKKRI
jgi:hypothetical protein